jgi:hypothetical protein
LNQRNFLRPSPAFELLLSRNGIEDLVKPWTAGETPALQSGKSLKDAILALPDAPLDIVVMPTYRVPARLAPM